MGKNAELWAVLVGMKWRVGLIFAAPANAVEPVLPSYAVL